MPRPYTLKLILKVLENMGFYFVSQTGSHAKYRKDGDTILTIIIPIHNKEIYYGTFCSILKQSGLKKEDFEKK